VPATVASVPVTDLAVQRGYGIFDFLKTVNGRIIFADEHLDRFFYSAAEMLLPVGYPKEDLLRILEALNSKNNIPNSGIRISLTGGAAADGYTISEPCLFMTQQKLELPGDAFFEKGIPLATYEHQRQLPHVKTIDYLMAIRLQPWLKQHAAADILYHQKGFITECPRANFFVVNSDGVLVTPKQNILNGITRKKILELAAPHLAVAERDLTLDEAKQCREAFITSTTKGILPVTSLDGKALNGAQPGPVSRMLCQELQRLWK
jgi:branched-chain amino acid aminotransferase